MFQHATYNPIRDEYFINTSTWDGLNGKSLGTTLRPDGTISTVTIDISGPAINGVTAVATAFNSVRDGYLATFRLAQAPQDIYGRYLASDGTPISPLFGIGSGDPPSVAYTPHTDRYLVTWSKLVSGVYYTYYALISGDPTAPTPVLAAGVIDSNALSAVVAYNPTSKLFLIVFVKDFAPNPRKADIFGRTVSSTGAVGPVFPINTGTKDQQRPVVAASKSGFAVVYEDWNTGASFPNAQGMLLDQNAAIYTTISVGTTPKWEVPGAITYNGKTDSYIVAWRSAGNVGLPEHYVQEFDAASGAPRAGAVSLTTQDSAILSAASRNVASAPQALVLWSVGVGPDGVHAGILPLTPVPTTLVAIGTPADGESVLRPFTITGWAADPAAPSGTGVSEVHVWAFPEVGSATFLGVATYGLLRPDVAAHLGDPRFEPSGFSLTANSLPDGNYSLGVYARSTVSGSFDGSAFVDVHVGPLPAMNVEAPGMGATVAAPFKVKGWAIDQAAQSGTGVDAVHIWAYPEGNGAPTFLGAANYGISRPDVATVFGDPNFEPSGFSHNVGTYLPAGSYTLRVFAHSTLTGTFNDWRDIPVTVVGKNYLMVDRPWNAGNVAVPFDVVGWALNTGAASGVGIDIVDVWDITTNKYLGRATQGISRPDVAATFGDAQFDPSGFKLTVNVALAAGSHTLRVWARNSSTGAFEIFKDVQVNVVVGTTPLTYVDAPISGSSLATPFQVRGWAADLGASSGTGVNAVHVWAFPAAGGAGVFLGVATLGINRPDVVSFLGNPNFKPSGYSLTVNTLAAGDYSLVVYARSTVSGVFNSAAPVSITVP